MTVMWMTRHPHCRSMVLFTKAPLDGGIPLLDPGSLPAASLGEQSLVTEDGDVIGSFTPSGKGSVTSLEVRTAYH